MKRNGKGTLLQRMMALLLSAVLTAGTAFGTAPLNVLAQENLGGGYNQTQESVSENTVEVTEEPQTESDEEKTDAEDAEESDVEPEGNPAEPGEVVEELETPGETDGQPETEVVAQAALLTTGAAPQTNDIASDDGWVLDANGKLTIQSNAGMTNWCSQSTNYSNQVISVEIKDGVTSIGVYAFRQCSALTDITIPDSVTNIGTLAFQGCSALESITIPNGVTSIGTGAFQGCSALESIAIPDGVTSIGTGAFSGCSALESITIPNGVTGIGVNTFYGCSDLESIAIPDGVTSIGTSAFQGCSDLESITIPSNVTSIGNQAFYNCSALTSITIPSNVTSIGYQVFKNCSSLGSVTMESSTPPTLEESLNKLKGHFEGCKFVTENTKGIKVPEGTVDAYKASWTEWTDYITDGTGWTLDNNGKLTIESDAGMANWMSLRQSSGHPYSGSVKTAEIQDGVTNIGNNAFWVFRSLEEITIPNSVTDIGDRAFGFCSSLKSITISDKVKSIGDSAFYECSALTGITIPDSVTSIGKEAFRSCSGLISISLSNRLTSIGECAFGNCSALTSITIPDGVTSIAENLCYDCSALTSITIPDSVTSIEGWAFEGCSALTGITIPDSVTSIGVQAFWNCSGLTSIVLPSRVTSIEPALFAGCSKLEEITIPDGVTSIGEEAFYGCSALESITIPTGVTDIGVYTFLECSSLTSVTLPDSITNIGYGLFYGCSKLEKITIPSSVMDIGMVAFFNCSNLESVTMKGSIPPTLGVMDEDTGETGVFTECKFVTDAAQGIKVPVGSVEAYKEAWPEWADYITEYNAATDDKDNVEEAQKAVEEALRNITATNETTAEDILEKLREALGDKAEVGGIEEFEKKDATEENPGQIILSIRITVNGETVVIHAAVAIPQLGKKTGVYVRFTDYYDMDGSTPLYKYTGLAIKPAVEVYNNEELLTLGTDYTVSYRNNTKPGAAAALTVKGKGNFSGTSNVVNFTIVNADIGKDTDHPAEMTVVANTKVAPLIMNGTKKLTTKDYQLEGEGLVNGKYAAVTEEGNPNTLTVKGTGSYAGSSFTVKVRVIDKKDARKLAVAVDKDFRPVYDGSAYTLSALFRQTADGEGAITVTDSKDKTKILKEGTDFVTVCTSSLTNAGTVKFTVTGVGEYTGSVSKSFKISPLKVTDSGRFSVTFDENKEYEYRASGVAVDNLVVKYLGETDSAGNGRILTQGVDYKVTYSNHKKVSAQKDAGLKITFLGNYKGSSAVSRTFKVVTAKLSGKNTAVTVPDKVYTKGNRAYKSTPIVTVDGVAIKASSYTVSYAWATESEAGDDTKYLADNKVKITIADGDTWARVRVTVTPKETGSYALAEGAVLMGEYYVRKADNAANLSKAKVTFFDKAGTQYKSLEYNGYPFYTPAGNDPDAENVPEDPNAVYVRVTAGGAVVDPSLYDVVWTNATLKGKATVVIRGKGITTDKGMAVGSKNQAISIKAMTLKGKTLKSFMENAVNAVSSFKEMFF